MCRIFVFAVCILLAYSIVEANRVKPVEKNERIAAKKHARPAAMNAKIDKTPSKIKKHDAQNEMRTTRKHLEKTEKVIPKEVKRERIFHKEKQNKEKRKLSTVDMFAHVNKHAKRQFNVTTAEWIPTLEELMSMWDAETMAFVNYLVNISGIELCVHHYAEFDDYDIGFVCEPEYCASADILCDYNIDCSYFNDETPQLCEIPDYYSYPEYEWECAWFCITGYDPYTGEEMWGEITCDDECDGYMDCYYGEDEYCGGWYETFGCPIHVYDYWGEEYWMYTTIDGGSVCDGFPDCADGSDEEECYWYPEISYDWNWYSDTSDGECAFNCEYGYEDNGAYIDYVNYIPCYWECDGYNDCGNYMDEYCNTDSEWNWNSDTSDDWNMDSYYKKSVDNKKSEEKKRTKMSKGRQERAPVRSNRKEKPSKKAKHGKQGKRHIPSVKKNENTVHHK